MKLILEAIKSLFRGVHNTLEQTVAELGKRIDTAQNTAETAKTELAADIQAAKTEAINQASIPILFLSTVVNNNYTVTTDLVTEYKTGMLIVVIPDSENTGAQAFLNINGLGNKEMTLPSMEGTSFAYHVPIGFVKKNRPVLLMYNGYNWTICSNGAEQTLT